MLGVLCNSAIGSIMYVKVYTRLDISLVVNVVIIFMRNPSKTH